MKVVKFSEEEVLVILETTSQDKEETKEILLPYRELLKWYPLNINYTYKYSTSKDIMYLVKDGTYKRDLYDVKSTKQAKALPLKKGVPYNKTVHNRNTKIVKWAEENNLIEVSEEKVLLTDPKVGICRVLETIESIKQHLVKKYIFEEGKNNDFDIDVNLGFPKFTDELIYKYATETELYQLELLGEVYTLLNLYRRLEE